VAEAKSDQEKLGRALERARAGEDRQLSAQVREAGEQVIRLLTGCLRMTRTHALNNRAFEDPIRQMAAAIERLYELLGAVHLVAVEDQVYVNDIRVRVEERGDGGGAGELVAELRRHRVGGLSFHRPPDEKGLRVMVEAFAARPDPDHPRGSLRKVLDAAGLETIELFGVFRFRVSGQEEQLVEERDEAKVAARAFQAVEEAWVNMEADRLPNPLPMRRAVTDILQGGNDAVALWDEPDGHSPYAAHVNRVTRLALLLGHAVGLSEELLQDLGVAAMFHDIGYAARETGTGAAGPGGVASTSFAPPFERHGSAGARLMLRQRGFHPAKIRRALASLEHHKDFSAPSGRPFLFARILRICEDYDNMTRRGGKEGSPAMALAHMAAATGARYDPVLLQLFINRLGRFPPGTRLKLADGRSVRVVELARDAETWDKPVCVVERYGDNTLPATRETVDLARTGKVVALIR
jgi:hypothetical protein